jgi:hypothetical protein
VRDFVFLLKEEGGSLQRLYFIELVAISAIDSYSAREIPPLQLRLKPASYAGPQASLLALFCWTQTFERHQSRCTGKGVQVGQCRV